MTLTTTGSDNKTPPFRLPSLSTNNPGNSDPIIAPKDGKLPRRDSSKLVIGAESGVVVFEKYISAVYDGHEFTKLIKKDPKPPVSESCKLNPDVLFIN